MVSELFVGHRRWLQRWQSAHPSARLLLGLWLSALICLALLGYPIFGALLLALYVTLGSLATLILTEKPPKVGRVVLGAPYNRILSQIAVLLGIIALTSLSISGYVPLWSEALAIFRGIGKAYFSAALLDDPEAALSGFGALFVIPTALLLLLRARWQELGVGRSHRTGQIALLWCALPLSALLVMLWARAITPAAALRSLLTNALYAFGAEFLFRGALQSRLVRVVAPRAAGPAAAGAGRHGHPLCPLAAGQRRRRCRCLAGAGAAARGGGAALVGAARPRDRGRVAG
ncbi:MAG: hypothetical protein ACK4P1_06845, partial [Aggregatilineales bacterium]